MSKRTTTVLDAAGVQMELDFSAARAVLHGDTANLRENAAMQEVMGKELWSAIFRTFDHMEVVEEEIAAAQERHADKPAVADMLYWTFGACRPTFEADKYAPQVYRAHVRELIERAADQWTGRAKKINLSMGTSAEMCIMFCEISYVSPLRAIAANLYLMNFVKIFGFNPVEGEEFPSGSEWMTQAVTEINSWQVWEEWEGQAEEEDNYTRRKMAQDWRVLILQDNGRWKIDYK